MERKVCFPGLDLEEGPVVGLVIEFSNMQSPLLSCSGEEER